EHQPGADPVKLAQEMRALLKHILADQARATARHKAHRIATGMPVQAGESMNTHHEPQKRCGEKADISRAGAVSVTRSATSRAVPADCVSPRWPWPKA